MRNWYEVAGGESAFLAADPRDGNIVYGAGQGVARFDKHTEQASTSRRGRSISPATASAISRIASSGPSRFSSRRTTPT